MGERFVSSGGRVVGVCLAVGLALAGIALTPSPGLAVDCQPGPLSTVMRQGQPADVYRGTAVNAMNVYDHNDPDDAPVGGGGTVRCDRVSSIFVYNSDTQGVELGWHTVPLGNSVTACNVDEDFPQQPFLMALKMTPGGLVCVLDNAHRREQLSSSTHNFKVNNPSFNQNFNYIVDGDSVGDAVTSWNAGNAIAAGEVHDADGGDSAHSQFTGLKYIGASGTHQWNDARCYINILPWYEGTRVGGNDDNLKVFQGSGFC